MEYKTITINEPERKHSEVNYGNIMANYMAEDSVNKIDSRRLKGIDNTADKKLQEILFNSDFKTERAKAGHAIVGIGYAGLGLIRYKDNWIIKFFRVLSYDSVLNTPIKVIAYADKYKIVNGIASELYYEWTIREEDGRIVRRTLFENIETGKLETDGKEYVYPKEVTTIPFRVIRNNENSTPDHWKVMSILQELNVLSNDIGKEWEYIKTQFQNQGVFGNGETSEDREKQVENGKRIFDQFSPNGKFAQQFQAFMSGSSTAQVLIQNIAFLEDRAMKYSMQGRDMDSSGTNKHNQQVGLFNQAHSEYNQKKKEQRERDYFRFFKEVVVPICEVKIAKSISFDNSAFEEGKLAGMQIASSNVENIKAQSQAQKAAAEKSKAAAEKDRVAAEQMQENNQTTK